MVNVGSTICFLKGPAINPLYAKVFFNSLAPKANNALKATGRLKHFFY
ncbi:MAG: hypothetical protein JWP69_458 [Flaviaesturariibacter sp.]|nr:hypothetical protein [Flaviaesturariibacter sp.]